MCQVNVLEMIGWLKVMNRCSLLFCFFLLLSYCHCLLSNTHSLLLMTFTTTNKKVNENPLEHVSPQSQTYTGKRQSGVVNVEKLHVKVCTCTCYESNSVVVNVHHSSITFFEERKTNFILDYIYHNQWREKWQTKQIDTYNENIISNMIFWQFQEKTYTIHAGREIIWTIHAKKWKMMLKVLRSFLLYDILYWFQLLDRQNEAFETMCMWNMRFNLILV